MTGRPNDPTRHVVAKVFALVAILVAALAIVAVFQTRAIERGILEVCATQQDGYVQLVLDQINLKENRDDEEIISDILETMDASSSKYWVFSRDQTMLFVKDVTETNRYKGFSAASYWGTADAQAFLDSLEEGRVKHDFIQVDGVDYLASGAIFEYDGRDYRLCLLTNRAALLDNNNYLGARSYLMVVMIVSLGLLVVIPMALAFVTAAARKKNAALQAEIADLNARLQDLSGRLAHKDLYDTRTHQWSREAFGPFIEKLLERGVSGAHIAQVICTDPEAAQTFLSRASIMLDEKVVRFEMADNIVALLFVSGDPDSIRRELAPVLGSGAELGVIVPVEKSEEASE